MNDELLTTLTHRAMACDFAVMLPSAEAHAVERVLAALEMLDDIEATLTVYRDSSEVSRVNREASVRSVRVSEATFRLLEAAIRWSSATDGAFDITAGPLVEAWGFLTRSGRKPSDEEVQRALSLVGYQNLILDASDQSVRFAVDGMSINLGAIGKGDALDRLAEELVSQGVNHFLLHGGQSSVVARGDQYPRLGDVGQSADSGPSAIPRGWKVGLSHPTKPRHRVAGIWLRDAALATSGSGKQFFHYQGRRYGHVIDPRTGYPAGDMLSLTVVCESAADADASATGLFVAGSEWIQQRELGTEPSKLICLKPGRRQDEVLIESVGEFDWVDE